MQPNPFAPPPSRQPVRKGTPFLHCAAGAFIWYIALIVAFLAAALKTRAGLVNLLPALVIGAVFWVLASTITWLILMRTRVQPWVLIPLTVPIYVLVWIVVGGLMGAFANVYAVLIS
ncbi:hypothetical protein C8D87_104224 [Lentzea atacamensis]|uniref:Uncharacterized protein n=1 Tax=Lentzea atacamensis TaxID=531938 RepID=A0ABX9E9D3_9PSEU|nr:hypothetical protein [Lentzea atacamensis]RAS65673.1 hypothetical protein C8D87_104224 [Lentzea atacamensis]